MGPLVPLGLISQDFDYIVAFFLGIAFGYILEQAGFSTSKKLVGVFYGYDFVVLRVFFTAAVTAVIGLIFMDFIGFIDFSQLYINPLFIESAVIGGAIMGLGFILGGFCPGTSLVAVATGKIDAMVFVIGGTIGVFAFGELYPMLEGLYMSSNLGPVFVFNSLGISKGVFVLALVIMALAAFVVTDKIEKKVKYGFKPEHPKYNMAKPAIGLGLALGLVILFLPDSQHSDLSKDSSSSVKESKITYISIEQIAFDIYYKTGKYHLIDTRPEAEYNRFCLTNSINIIPENISKLENRPFFTHPNKTAVFYSNDENISKQAYEIALKKGYNSVAIMKSGLNGFKEKVFNSKEITTAGVIGDANTIFISKFRDYLNSDTSLTKPRTKPKVIVKAKKIQGGC